MARAALRAAEPQSADAIEAMLALGAALTCAFRYDEAEATLKAALQQAGALDIRKLRAHALEDAKRLARVMNIDLAVLADRSHEELRPYLTGPVERHDLTFQLWLDAIREDRRNHT